MPANSKSQQRLMGMVHAYQKGDLKTKDIDKSLVNKIKDMAKQMKPKDTKDFAKTKHENLPQKVEMRTNKFKDFSLLEYSTNEEEIDMTKLFNTINSETNPKILDDLFQILQTRKEYQERIEQHYKDDKNMLLFPYEVTKERDLSMIDMLIGLLRKRKDKIDSGDIETIEFKEIEYPTPKKIGFGTSGEEAQPVTKQDVKTAYKRSGNLGYKFRHMESFMKFYETKKDISKELRKELNKQERERRLKSGADLKTKVVSDKKKYKRSKSKKINLEEN